MSETPHVTPSIKPLRGIHYILATCKWINHFANHLGLGYHLIYALSNHFEKSTNQEEAKSVYTTTTGVLGI